MEPRVEEDEDGYVVKSGIHTYGETVHIFIERDNYKGAFLPGFKPWKSALQPGARGPEVRGPHGGQRGLERDEHLGGLLRPT
jgi:hypothetical protein